MLAQSIPLNQGCSYRQGMFRMVIESTSAKLYLYEVSAVNVLTINRDETTATCLHQHGVGSGDRRARLRAQSVFRLAQQLLHKINSLVGYVWSRGEAQRLFPVQYFLAGDVTLQDFNEKTYAAVSK